MLARLGLGLVICGLLACGGNSRAPVEDRVERSQSSFHRASASAYRVQGGDTLYSIAFRYGLDYRKVAAANKISAPYTIFPGQQIYLNEAAVAAVAVPKTAVPKAVVPPKMATPSSKSAKPTVAASASRPVLAKKPPVTVTGSRAGTAPYKGGKVNSWRWPTSGPVTRKYSSSVHKGIDIAGSRGDTVVAVADGKVVYAGTGIVGFGELLIIKHNEIYLSAYGHNDSLLVAEGETVRAGQTIAGKGSSGTDTVKLHFEIRKEGKPIDPQRLLPRR
ncbi:MAG: peptidoglycan DD-metalloendopeptidase family protein [Halioglobus sp.]|nr:peptidoglycan DD-metalloendopeptidase family protein [Halioglobus sp.]